MDKVSTFIISLLVLLTIFLCGYCLALDNSIKEVYKPINFEIRKYRVCSEDAQLKKGMGMSMFPYSNDKGYFYIDNVSFNDIEIGDVILYKKGNKSIHHAVINKYADKIYTAGYNNKYPDTNPVYSNEIIGRDCDTLIGSVY